MTGGCAGPGIGNWDRRMNLRCDSSINSAAASKRSGLRGASTRSAFGYSPCKVPNAMSGSGSSVATTLPETMRAQRPKPLRILFALHEESAGIGKRVFQEGPKKKTKSAETALVARKRPVRDASAHEKRGNSAPPGFPHKIRPDFGLEHQNQ